jgi:hypothetical protein
VGKTHILIDMIKDNPFHYGTTVDEKYPFRLVEDRKSEHL